MSSKKLQKVDKAISKEFYKFLRRTALYLIKEIPELEENEELVIMSENPHEEYQTIFEFPKAMQDLADIISSLMYPE